MVLRDVKKYIQVLYSMLIGLIFGSSPLNTPEICKSLTDSIVLKVTLQGTTLQWVGFEVASDQSNVAESDTFNHLLVLCQRYSAKCPIATSLSFQNHL